jgi:predicted dithiol-disulfide oxidoreductase (DUF899 family)
MNRPLVVSAEEWQAARDALLVKEKELIHALAAQRRRLPMVKFEKDYEFTAPDGSTGGLASLFGDKRQLVIDHFMLEPGCAAGARRSPTASPTPRTSTPATPG